MPGLAGPRGEGHLIDGRPEHREPDFQCRTHDRILGSPHHDRRAFRAPGTSAFHSSAPLPPGTTVLTAVGAWRIPPHGAPDGPVSRAGQAFRDISAVDNNDPRVDDLTARSFFLTHPVDGIIPGSEGSAGQSYGVVLSAVPSRRTGRAACLHRLSTGLCTARLDADQWAAEDYRQPLGGSSGRIVGARYYCRISVLSWSCP